MRLKTRSWRDPNSIKLSIIYTYVRRNVRGCGQPGSRKMAMCFETVLLGCPSLAWPDPIRCGIGSGHARLGVPWYQVLRPKHAMEKHGPISSIWLETRRILNILWWFDSQAGSTSESNTAHSQALPKGVCLGGRTYNGIKFTNLSCCIMVKFYAKRSLLYNGKILCQRCLAVTQGKLLGWTALHKIPLCKLCTEKRV